MLFDSKGLKYFTQSYILKKMALINFLFYL